MNLLLVAATLLLAVLIGHNPMAWAIGSVFLLAGPHNWQEARYILGRLPARSGRLWPYLCLSVGGWAVLSMSYIAIWVEAYEPGFAWWNVALIFWVGALARLRSRENPRRSWPWLTPVALLVASWARMYPTWFAVALIYAHPLLALWIADRELLAQRHAWRRELHRLLPWIALGLAVVLALTLPWAADAVGDDQFRGLLDLPGNTPAWLAAHVYLECIHYAIWIALLPAVAARLGRNRLERMPLLRKATWRVQGARIGLVLGALAVLALWWSFHCAPETTRTAYFVLAIGHVLVEYPFVLRVL